MNPKIEISQHKNIYPGLETTGFSLVAQFAGILPGYDKNLQ